ncbi:MAG TPA: hypothetical protein DCF49_05395 [Lachnospiraceae bacterium]|nr:hypothetical protein [Lachnospiraceae bacterium]
MTAREYLTRYRDAVREAREIELNMMRIRLRYTAPAAINYSDMPKAHNTEHDLSDYAAKMEELSDLLLQKYEKCIAIQIDIEMRLDRMTGYKDAQIDREILRHRYTNITDKGRYCPWELVADAVGYSVRQVKTKHGSALQHFPMDDLRI